MSITAGVGVVGRGAPGRMHGIPYAGNREISLLAAEQPGAIRLEIGQPSFPTPPHVLDAVREELGAGHFGYTPTQGSSELREHLAAKLARVNGVRVDPASELTIAPGGVGALAAILAALTRPGDEVLVPDPAWPNYLLMTATTATTAVRYPCPAASGFEPDVEALESLVTPRTRVLVVNNPNNPTGAVYDAATLAALLDVAARHDLWVVSDECYDQIDLCGSYRSLLGMDGDGRVVAAFTFSKTYAMAGWRIGYAAGPARVIDAVVKVLEACSSCVTSVSQRAAEAALTGPQECVSAMVEEYRQRAELACDLLGGAGLLVAKPLGAFYVMADISQAGMGSRDFALELLAERSVAVAPGAAFGPSCDGYVRISLASPAADLREGIARTVDFVHGRR